MSDNPSRSSEWFYSCFLCNPRLLHVQGQLKENMISLFDTSPIFQASNMRDRVPILFMSAVMDDCSEEDFNYKRNSPTNRAFRAYLCTDRTRGTWFILQHMNFTPTPIQSWTVRRELSRFGVIYP